MNKEEKLDKVLEEIAKLNSKVDITLTPDELEVLTEYVSTQDLEEKEEYLTKKYNNILLSFGCVSYKELYDIAQDNQKELVEKNKNFSNLAREKREVTRDGSTFETTLYVDPKLGVDNKIKPRKNKGEIATGNEMSAKELQAVIISNKELAEAKKYTKDLTFVLGEYEKATLAKHLVDVYGIVQASIGFKVTEDGVGELAYIATSGLCDDVAVRSFFELVRFCLFNQLDCRFDFMQGTRTQRYLGEAYKFTEEEDGSLVSTFEVLKDTFGSLE